MTVGKHVVYFDGHCRLCRAAGPRLARYGKPGAIELRDFRAEVELAPELRAQLEAETVLVTPEGRRYGGADAIVHALGTRRVLWLVLWLYFVWPIGPIARAVYRWIAARRFRLALASGACDGACSVHRPGASATKPALRIAPRAMAVGLRIDPTQKD